MPPRRSQRLAAKAGPEDLIQAVLRRDLPALQAAVAARDAPLDTTALGFSALHAAALADFPEAIPVLLSAGEP